MRICFEYVSKFTVEDIFVVVVVVVYIIFNWIFIYEEVVKVLAENL